MFAMKPRHSFASVVLLIFAFACAVCISTGAQGGPPFNYYVRSRHVPPGHLTIDRVPNFGWNRAFHLLIDGRSVASIVQGHRYDGWVSAGRHVLTVSKVPYIYSEPISRIVNVQPGWTYVFTAMWDSDLVFLHPSGAFLSPGAIWQLRGNTY